MSALADLEERVTAKFLAAAAGRTPEFDTSAWDIDMSQWQPSEPLPPDTPQFPRQQWVVYPTRRAVVLTIIDRALDLDLTDEQWSQACFLFWYGGRERIA